MRVAVKDDPRVFDIVLLVYRLRVPAFLEWSEQLVAAVMHLSSSIRNEPLRHIPFVCKAKNEGPRLGTSVLIFGFCC